MYGASRLERRDTWLSEARLRVEWLRQHLAAGTVLEVGSGTGEFVKAASDAGFDAYGIEPSEWAAAHGRALGVRVETGFLEDWTTRYPDVRPEVVVLWHTIEHIPDPVALLSGVRSVLAPGGLVMLEVPNYASTDARRLGIEWDGAQPDEHHFQLTPAGMDAMLRRSGFDITDVTPITQEVYASSERWRAQRDKAAKNGWDWPPLDLLRAWGR